MEGSRVFHRNLLTPLGTGAEGEESPQQVDCYRSGGETGGRGGLDLEEWRQTWRSAFSLPVSLARVASGFQCLWGWELR